MPTAGRRRFVPQAIQYFLRQDYSDKELVILDDGTESVADLVPDDPQVRYIRLIGKRTLGAKRNECVEASRGDLIMHWDDDDWMAPHRIRYQVEAMLREGGEVCGLRCMLFYEPATGKTWLYNYPAHQRLWLAGGSLLYTRDFWRRAPFPDLQIASDTRFIWNRRLNHTVVLPDYTFYVAMIHPGNTSPKNCRGVYWSRWPGDLQAIMGKDLDFWKQDRPLVMTHHPSELCKRVREADVTIVITTYNRPDDLRRLLKSLIADAVGYTVNCLIYNDGSNLRYEDIPAGNHDFKIRHIDMPRHYGKPEYWKLMNRIFQDIKNLVSRFYLQLPDDVEVRPGFFAHAIETYNKVRDPGKICLKRKFFAALDFRLHPISPLRWKSNPRLSSGVGMQMTHRLQGHGLYQVRECHLVSSNAPSVMNPDRPASENLSTCRLEPIICGVASVPERAENLKLTLNSILPYTDELRIWRISSINLHKG